MRIDSEFQKLCGNLTSEEYTQLEANLVAEGCRDPLVLWNDTLLDGHNRVEICEKYGIPFSTISIDLPDRDAALVWILGNQLGRRNLTPEQTSYLRGKRYEMEKRKQGRPNKDAEQKRYQNDTLKTRQNLAKEHGVGEQTIMRDAAFAQGVDVLPETERKKVLSGKSELNKGDVQELGNVAKTPDGEKRVEAAVQAYQETGKRETFRHALKPKSQYDNRLDAEYDEVLDHVDEAHRMRIVDIAASWKPQLKVSQVCTIYRTMDNHPDKIERILSHLETNLSKVRIVGTDMKGNYDPECIAKLLADIYKNPGIVAEWFRLTTHILEFQIKYDIDELAETLISEKKSIVQIHDCLSFLEKLEAKVESQLVILGGKNEDDAQTDEK
jgi:hypothetical protein